MDQNVGRELDRRIDAALLEIEPMERAGLPQAKSIYRQLLWCKAFLADQPRESRPGPFSMGIVATREFDMYGSQPELATAINDIQRGIEAMLT